MALPERTILGARPPSNQKVESDCGATKFGDNSPLETDKVPRTEYIPNSLVSWPASMRVRGFSSFMVCLHPVLSLPLPEGNRLSSLRLVLEFFPGQVKNLEVP